MGTSVQMIEKHFGHLAADADEWEFDQLIALDNQSDEPKVNPQEAGQVTPTSPQTQSGSQALFRTRTGDPLLTILGARQLVATHGNGFGLFEPFSGQSHLPPVATGCDRSAP